MGFNSGFKGLKFFELKIILVINLRKKTVYFSFYFNLQIISFFLPNPILYSTFKKNLLINNSKSVLVTTTNRSQCGTEKHKFLCSLCVGFDL